MTQEEELIHQVAELFLLEAKMRRSRNVVLRNLTLRSAKDYRIFLKVESRKCNSVTEVINPEELYEVLKNSICVSDFIRIAEDVEEALGMIRCLFKFEKPREES